MSNGIRFDLSSLAKGLTKIETKAGLALMKYAESSAAKLESNAKSNARWTDRTGDARRRLKGDVLTVQNGYKLRLAHGVDYGKWLELAHERRYAIIEETIRFVGTFEIMPGLDKLLERLGGMM